MGKLDQTFLSILVNAQYCFGANISALPEGGKVVSGSAVISQQDSNMRINQSSQRASLTWNSFNIGSDAQVTFEQPNSDAVAVNRILGADGSHIMGRLSANGNVYLINPNGVIFGASAQVNVGGLVASTLNLNQAKSNDNSLHFENAGAGSVENYGSLNAGEGGYVALLGKEVKNNGVIVANMGTVAMGAGEEATLTFSGNRLLSFQVDKGAVDTLAENAGLIKADGGQVYMSAQAANELSSAVVNHSGIIEARSLLEREGKIILLGDMLAGSTHVSGTLDASAPKGGDGGFIETSAAHVKIEDSARITTAANNGLTGQWLVDPNDYTIAASGGDISGAALSTNLSTTNVTLQSDDGASGVNGDIFVNDSVNWASGNNLTLSAFRDILINQAIVNTGGGNLILRSGNTTNGVGGISFGGSGSVAMGGGGRADLYYNPTNFTSPINYSGNITGTHAAWMLVNNVNQLQDINTNTSGTYALAGDIDASATSTWNGGNGLVPLGSETDRFFGDFDGLNHSISNLHINRPTENTIGLFGFAETDSTISNLELIAGTGSITGDRWVGGVAGLSAGSITNVSSSLNVVSNSDFAGGLIGFTYETISNSYATGNVSAAGSWAGGLAGYSSAGEITNSFASGAVTASSNAGGLVGQSALGGTISNSYASGTVHADSSHAGGLVGYNTDNSTISASYAMGAVTGSGGATEIKGLLPRDFVMVGNLVKDICYNNASNYFGFEL